MTLEDIGGVSTKTSANVWHALGPDTLAGLDSDVAVQKLQESGYGSRKTCQNLKQKWDARKGVFGCCVCEHKPVIVEVLRSCL
mgnify:FL=1